MLRTLKSRYLRWRAERRPIPEQLWSATWRALPQARALPARERARLREMATMFVLDKSFASAHGLRVTEAMSVQVAVRACLPVLELGLDYYAQFQGVVLYPGDFRVREQHVDEAGVVHEQTRDLCGQSLALGPMVLSWDTLANERAVDGQDLVIHECAHKLDVLNGNADGFPPLHADMSARRWTGVFRAAYDRLCQQVDAGHATRLDPYASADAAEFFAVTSETFFTRPDIVYEDFPDVYAQLAAFYRQNPYSLTGA